MRSPSRCHRVSLANVVRASVVVFALNIGALPVVRAEQNFNTADAAMTALGEAVANNEESALQAMFGRDFRNLIPPAGAEIRGRFIDAWSDSHKVETIDSHHARIAVGDDGWTFPIPLVRTGDTWHFDMHAGAEEMRLRRIGRNELAVIQTMLAVYDAQRDYALTDHSGDGVLTYASKLVSSPGKHDGLYWPTQTDAPESPLGPAFIQASTRNGPNGGYHGYHYKLLTSQGPHAPGGAYNYVAQGKLFGGFAVIAWPVRYGDTGIKSFMVSHAGQVYERDLGPDSATRAKDISTFDPGPDWAKVEVQQP